MVIWTLQRENARSMKSLWRFLRDTSVYVFAVFSFLPLTVSIWGWIRSSALIDGFDYVRATGPGKLNLDIFSIESLGNGLLLDFQRFRTPFGTAVLVDWAHSVRHEPGWHWTGGPKYSPKHFQMPPLSYLSRPNGPHPLGFQTDSGMQSSGGIVWNYYDLSVPYWAVTMFFALIPGALLTRALFRASRPEGSCPVCGYDLCATPNRCPECGTAVQLNKEKSPSP
jgi:hypothetical protein